MNWRNIPDFKLYEMSETGEVRNKQTLKNLKVRNNKGNLEVILYKDDWKTHYSISIPSQLEALFPSCEWFPIIGFDNYLISKEGSVVRKIKHSGLYKLKINSNKLGYKNVLLTNNDNVKKTIPLHRLLATTFIPNPENKPLVDHINRNPEDNQLSNLRWATHIENSRNRVSGSNTGTNGVNKVKNIYSASITINHKCIQIGRFFSLDEAKQARFEAETKHYNGFGTFN
jgi:hypothetical protein